jgi:2-dehydro-3-deoxyphosphogluconate aldolase/(4S)-4-hydroxy-2-oxoglutarate aldolase
MIELRQELQKVGVVPVLALDHPQEAAPIAEILCEAGLTMIEITLRTEAALAVLEAMATAQPQALLGVGTVKMAAQLRQAADRGARFAVSPGFIPTLAGAAAALKLPLLPGVASATELMAAQAYGLDTLKLFPAQAIGGVKLLQAFHAPFPEVAFCPTGGIGPDNAPAYLELPNVAAVGGSWMVPRDLLAARDWSAIAHLARQAAALRRPMEPSRANPPVTAERQASSGGQQHWSAAGEEDPGASLDR